MSAAAMWGGRPPLEAGRAGSAPVIVGQREQSLSDIWDRGIASQGSQGCRNVDGGEEQGN